MSTLIHAVFEPRGGGAWRADLLHRAIQNLPDVGPDAWPDSVARFLPILGPARNPASISYAPGNAV